MMKIENGKFKFCLKYKHICLFLDIIAPNGYEILNFNETEGIENPSDKGIGYIENPRINMELKIDEYIYKLHFIEEYEKPYYACWACWYLYLNPNPKYKTKIKIFRCTADTFYKHINRCIQRKKFDKLKFKA